MKEKIEYKINSDYNPNLLELYFSWGLIFFPFTQGLSFWTTLKMGKKEILNRWLNIKFEWLIICSFSKVLAKGLLINYVEFWGIKGFWGYMVLNSNNYSNCVVGEVKGQRGGQKFIFSVKKPLHHFKTFKSTKNHTNSGTEELIGSEGVKKIFICDNFYGWSLQNILKPLNQRKST